jgi:hypothetical protein
MGIKTRFIQTELLQQTWLDGVNRLLFPPALVDELRPFELLALWADDLPAKRRAYRLQVDFFVDKLLKIETPEGFWRALREADPRLVALYFDRIQAANLALERIKKTVPVAEIPDSWQTTVSFLLLQKLFQ